MGVAGALRFSGSPRRFINSGASLRERPRHPRLNYVPEYIILEYSTSLFASNLQSCLPCCAMQAWHRALGFVVNETGSCRQVTRNAVV
ncbi:hypothetical protein Pan54_28020 [Rubinisphaera italica]|uniref:Uncharacterized protein n=1 Tax=Rubinisphaera italica TaxID=2527969 RepID=A0A5C5XIB0_9PLAN|nr:hypothetical protein Pan54_28020 [Rubinisphaera italica]